MARKPTRTALDSKDAPASVCHLPAQLTIEHSEALHELCKQWSMQPALEIIIDASAVENVTTPGLQLLFALRQSLSTHNKTHELRGIPEVMQRACRDLGLEQ